MKAIVQFFVSLRLTVVLLALSMILIFFGTLDQVHTGIWATQEKYFESFIAIWDVPDQWTDNEFLARLRVPMPGGYLIGGLLFINLVAAHLYRFKLSWKKTGIQLVHAGLILLLLSELLTDLLAKESQMPVNEGGRANYSLDYRDRELVFIDRSPDGYDEVISIPTRLLESKGTIDIPGTDLQVQTLEYYPNSQVARAEGPQAGSLANRGAGARMGIVVNEQPVDYSTNGSNVVSAFVRVIDGDEALGTWLVSDVIDERFPPQMVPTSGGEMEMALRFKRTYYPFQVELIDFKHDKYPGTEIPFNFSSEVAIHHNDSEKNARALIYMNHPLRYEGLTFYQASFANNDQTSIFQVVRNPGWTLPYISVLMMGLGLVVQFGMHLFKFLNKRRART